MRKAFESIDTDGNGSIDREEFLAYVRRQPNVSEDVAMEAFRAFDEDGNLSLSFDEFVHVLETSNAKRSWADQRRNAIQVIEKTRVSRKNLRRLSHFDIIAGDSDWDHDAMEALRRRVYFQTNCCTVCLDRFACCEDRCTEMRPGCEALGNAIGIVGFSLPCFDETDDGVPPFCQDPRCPLNHRNKYTNDSKLCHMWGNIGWKYFDRNRKFFMGFATLVTIFTIFVTSLGAFSLSTDSGVIQTTYWAKAHVYDSNSSALVEVAYLGLNTIVQVSCTATDRVSDPDNPYKRSCISKETSTVDLGWIMSPISRDSCVETAIMNSGTSAVGTAFCKTCRESVIAMQFGAFVSCVSLIFALLGTMNRMRFSSDAPVQKLLGAVTDTFGACILGWTGGGSSRCT